MNPWARRCAGLVAVGVAHLVDDLAEILPGAAAPDARREPLGRALEVTGDERDAVAARLRRQVDDDAAVLERED